MSNKKGALLTEEQRLEKVLTKKKRRKIALKIFIGVCGDHYHDLRHRCSV